MKLKKLFGAVIGLAAAMIMFGSCLIISTSPKYAFTIGNNIEYSNGRNYKIRDISVYDYYGSEVKYYSGTLNSGEKKTFYLSTDYYYFYFYDCEKRTYYYTDYIYLDRDIIFLTYQGQFYNGSSWSVRAATIENDLPKLEISDADGNLIKVLELHEVVEPITE